MNNKYSFYFLQIDGVNGSLTHIRLLLQNYPPEEKKLDYLKQIADKKQTLKELSERLARLEVTKLDVGENVPAGAVSVSLSSLYFRENEYRQLCIVNPFRSPPFTYDAYYIRSL